ncbi:hypothetical protein ABFS83_10G043300 [Erythranthe nasuta]
MAASWKSHHHRYLGGADRLSTAEIVEFEFDEDEIWGSNNNNSVPEAKTFPVYSNPRPLRKPLRKGHVDHLSVGPRSVPVNVPDWSKILGGEYKKRAGGECVDEEGGNDKIPPHEYLARTRVASFSVHEGAGRTLKGRDLSRVRNAIWKQTGFED